ncbi:MAG: hypothetical protein JWM32_1599 [Verrucomicrobia bacterium]|nr:hypothetical protein [Verrucomicrobiota bacterium]
MGIENPHGQRVVAPAPPPSWGEVVLDGQQVRAIRFCLADRVVTFPVTVLKKWEHLAGEPEILTLSAGNDHLVIEGVNLALVRAALDLGRLAEVRMNYDRLHPRPGPIIRAITLETP